VGGVAQDVKAFSPSSGLLVRLQTGPGHTQYGRSKYLVDMHKMWRLLFLLFSSVLLAAVARNYPTEVTMANAPTRLQARLNIPDEATQKAEACAAELAYSSRYCTTVEQLRFHGDDLLLQNVTMYVSADNDGEAPKLSSGLFSSGHRNGELQKHLSFLIAPPSNNKAPSSNKAVLIPGITFVSVYVELHIPHVAEYLFHALIAALKLVTYNCTCVNVLLHDGINSRRSQGARPVDAEWYGTLFDLWVNKVNILNPHEFSNRAGMARYTEDTASGMVDLRGADAVQFEYMVVPVLHEKWFHLQDECNVFRRHVWRELGFKAADLSSLDVVIIQRKVRGFVNVHEISNYFVHRNVSIRVVDFATVHPTQQIGILAHTRLLVTMHGAALTNIAFMPRNSVVVEVLPYLYYHDAYFRKLGISCGLHYFQHLVVRAEHHFVAANCFTKFGNYTHRMCSRSHPCRSCMRTGMTQVDMSALGPILDAALALTA
jgi:hypothetical protein